MAQTDTFIIRVALDGAASIYRDIEIEALKSLYKLAEAIVSAFAFDFDHAFGFYNGEACFWAAMPADYDNDQDIDAAVNDAGWFRTYTNNGTGTFGAQRVITTSAPGAREVAVGDFDGDGDIEAIIPAVPAPPRATELP